MSQDTITLTAEPRQQQGTRAARRLRRDDKLPAVVYGHGEDNQSVTLPLTETVRHINTGAQLFDLSLGGGSQPVLLKDVQYNYLGDEILHVDLFRVNLSEEVTSDVPLVLVGEPGGKDEGAALTQTRDQITVVCKVRDLPDEIKHDVSGMNVGDALHVNDLTLPDGVKLPEGDEYTVATLAIPKRVLAAEEEEIANADGAEPEIINQNEGGEDNGPPPDQNA